MIHFYCDKDLPFFELKSCDTSELSYKKHAHEEYSIGIVKQGRSNFWYEGKTDEIGPRTVVVLPSNLMHSCNPIDRNLWNYKMLYINKDWMQGFVESKSKLAFNCPIVKDVSCCKTFDLVSKMMESIQSNSGPLEKEANILAVFDQSLAGEKKTVDIDYKKEQPKLKIVKKYLQRYFAEKVTLDQLEVVSGLSKFHIIRLFKEAFKIPPHTFQTLLRVNFAKKELRRNRPLLEVAHERDFMIKAILLKSLRATQEQLRIGI